VQPNRIEIMLNRVPMPRTLRSVILTGFVSIGLAAMAAGGWAEFLQLTGNIHEVEPGKLYRSAQLSPEQLQDLIKTQNIRTVINLRGARPGENWYDNEVKVIRATGVSYITLPLSANHEPDSQTLAKLTEILDNAPQPILVHCKAGADRTGLASALFELRKMGKPVDQAEDQLSFRYGHFPWLTSRTGAMDRAFSNIVAGKT